MSRPRATVQVTVGNSKRMLEALVSIELGLVHQSGDLRSGLRSQAAAFSVSNIIILRTIGVVFAGTGS